MKRTASVASATLILATLFAGIFTGAAPNHRGRPAAAVAYNFITPAPPRSGGVVAFGDDARAVADVHAAYIVAVYLDAVYQLDVAVAAYLEALHATDVYLAALAAPRPSAPRSSIPSTGYRGGYPSDGWWDRVAVCEEGGWGTHTHASNEVGTFVGDLGILEGLWDSIAGPLGLPPGWAASREQQIEVADVAFARFGASAWSSGSCTGPPF